MATVGGDITNPQSLNRYAYVLNNPTTLVDPKGLQGQPPAGTTCGHGGPPIPFGQNPATYCYNHMPLGWGIMAGTIGWLPGSSEDAIAGNDIFDAISGAPGTYLTLDSHGNMGFGFSSTLWGQTQNLIDSERSGINSLNAQFNLGLNPGLIPTTGYVVVSQSTGMPGEYLTSGVVPDLNAAAAAQQQLVAMLPGPFQAIYAQNLQNPQNGDPLTRTLGQFQVIDPAGFSQLQPYVSAFVVQQAVLANELATFFGAPYPQH